MMLSPPFNFSHIVSFYKGLAVNPSEMRCPLYFEEQSPEEQSRPGRGRRAGHDRPEQGTAGACLPPASAAQAAMPHGDEARRPRWGRGHRHTWRGCLLHQPWVTSPLHTQGALPRSPRGQRGAPAVGRQQGCQRWEAVEMRRRRKRVSREAFCQGLLSLTGVLKVNGLSLKLIKAADQDEWR